MGNRATAKAKSNKSWRWAMLNGFAFNHEPRFKRERRKQGASYRNLSDGALLKKAMREALANDAKLKLGRTDLV